MDQHSYKLIDSWISIISLLSLARQDELNKREDDNEPSEHENEWPQIFHDSKEHLNKIGIFFLVSNVLKQFYHWPKNYNYFDQIITKLSPIVPIWFANIHSDKQVNLKEYQHNHIKKVVNILQIFQKPFFNLR